MSDIGDIQLTRKLGHGLIVDHAPPRARMALSVLANTGWGATVQGPDRINIGDQVLYRVTGYDPASASLLLELVEDWRPAPTATLSEADVEAFKARWLETYGKPGAAHLVTELADEERPRARPARTEGEVAGWLEIIDAATGEEQAGV